MSILLGNSIIVDKKYHKVKRQERFREDALTQLKGILEELKIETHNISEDEIKKQKMCDFFWCRDSFVKIDDKYVLLPGNDNQKYGIIRKYEYKILQNMLSNYIVNDKKDSKIEGGDIIQYKDDIFIGYHERTNRAGIQFIRKSFPHKFIHEINHRALHLDCCLSVLHNKVLIYSSTYIKSLPEKIKLRYTCIKLEDILKKHINVNLALNFLVISKNIITSYNKKFKELYNFLENMHYTLYFIKDYKLAYEGGGIRCMTQWLRYPEYQYFY